jgi:hypothetical protein
MNCPFHDAAPAMYRALWEINFALNDGSSEAQMIAIKALDTIEEIPICRDCLKRQKKIFEEVHSWKNE